MTPENAVGIGGAYLCVYGMEGPGGYQFVGRTIQMWNPLRETEYFKKGKPWLLNFFDRLKFYPCSADEILQYRDDFLRGKFHIDIEETTFNLGKYKEYLESIKESAQNSRHIKRHHSKQKDRDGLKTDLTILNRIPKRKILTQMTFCLTAVSRLTQLFRAVYGKS